MQFIPAKFAWFLKQGELREKPAEALLNLAETYREEHEIALYRFSAAMLPVTILLLGAMIGFCVIALYMPLFEIPMILFRMER